MADTDYRNFVAAMQRRDALDRTEKTAAQETALRREGEQRWRDRHQQWRQLFGERMDKTIEIVLAWCAEDFKAFVERKKRGDKESLLSLFRLFGEVLEKTAVFYAGFAWAAVAATARLPVKAHAASAPSPSAPSAAPRRTLPQGRQSLRR